jgi:hypothetical protein
VKKFHAEIKTAIHANASAVFDVLSVDHLIVCLDF